MQLCANRWKSVQVTWCNCVQIYANMCTYVQICPNQIVHLCANMCRHFPGFFRNYQVVIQVTHYDLSVWCHIWSRLCRAQNASAQLWFITDARTLCVVRAHIWFITGARRSHKYWHRPFLHQRLARVSLWGKSFGMMQVDQVDYLWQSPCRDVDA